jgi:5-methylcytosine-specific restriction protein A
MTLVTVGDGRCIKHKAQIERGRGSAAARGYDARWRAFRADYLRDHPLCINNHDGRIVPATVVDHIITLRLAPHRKYEKANLQALCKRCHDVKTVRRDGGLKSPIGRD